LDRTIDLPYDRTIEQPNDRTAKTRPAAHGNYYQKRVIKPYNQPRRAHRATRHATHWNYYQCPRKKRGRKKTPQTEICGAGVKRWGSSGKT